MKKYTLAGITASLVFGAALAYSGSAQYTLLLSAPVESVSKGSNTVFVLGHALQIHDASRYLPGQTINVYGEISRTGSVSAKLIQNTGHYLASGDAVFVAGKVSVVDRTRGTMTVDGARIDFTALLSRPGFVTPNPGRFVQVVGTLPAGRGVLLASRVDSLIRVSGGAQAVGVSGSGQALGVSGSGQALGVSGSGQAVGVSGSGQVLGVSGSGQALGVSGSGQAVGVSGSGQVLGVSGSGQALGVSGSGQAVGVSGSGQVLGVSGSGQALGVSGSGQALGVSGSGQALGVSGSGQALGVSGSGQALGVSGSGFTHS